MSYDNKDLDATLNMDSRPPLDERSEKDRRDAEEYVNDRLPESRYSMAERHAASYGHLKGRQTCPCRSESRNAGSVLKRTDCDVLAVNSPKKARCRYGVHDTELDLELAREIGEEVHRRMCKRSRMDRANVVGIYDDVTEIVSAALAAVRGETVEMCAIRGRLAQLENKVVDVEIRALKKGKPNG